MNKFLGLSLFAIVSSVIVFFSIATTNSNADDAYEIYRYETSDTITNTGADTILLTPNLFSFFKSNHTLYADTVSGTLNIAFVVQESPSLTGDEWYNADSTSLTTVKGTVSQTSDVYGLRRRIILTGTGTQVSTYTLRSIFKKDYN